MLNTIMFLSTSLCTLSCFALTLIAKFKKSHKLSTAAVAIGVCGLILLVFRFALHLIGVM